MTKMFYCILLMEGPEVSWPLRTPAVMLTFVYSRAPNIPTTQSFLQHPWLTPREGVTAPSAVITSGRLRAGAAATTRNEEKEVCRGQVGVPGDRGQGGLGTKGRRPLVSLLSLAPFFFCPLSLCQGSSVVQHKTILVFVPGPGTELLISWNFLSDGSERLLLFVSSSSRSHLSLC